MRKVVQTWEEDMESKKGWSSDGWFYDDNGELVNDNLYEHITVTDTDKFFNPIEGVLENE